MRELGVIKTGIIKKRRVGSLIHIATVEFYVGPPQHPNQTRIDGVAAAPVKNRVGILQKVLAAFKNTRLPADDSKISRVRMKIGIPFALRLNRVKFY